MSRVRELLRETAYNIASLVMILAVALFCFAVVYFLVYKYLPLSCLGAT